MKRLQDYNRKNVIFCISLFIILFLAFFIRYHGIKFGLPIAPHPDEPMNLLRASNIVNIGDFNPHFFRYPSLYIYMQAGLIGLQYTVGELTGNYYSFAAIDKSTSFIIGRLLTLIFSLGTILIVYAIGRLLFDRTTGLISTLFISFSFLHITHSYLITVDSPMVFWAVLAFLMSTLIFVNGPKLRYYIFNGIFVGLAIGTKYTAFLGIVPLIYSHLYTHSFSIKKIFHSKLIFALLSVLLAFLISTPYSILDFNNFYKDILWEANHYSTGHPGYESESTSYTAYFLYLLNGFGGIPIIISFLGIVYLTLKSKSKAILLLLFPTLFFVFVGRYKVHFSRNILIAVPFLSICSGFLIAMVFKIFCENLKYCERKIREKHNSHILLEYNFYLSTILLALLLIAVYGIYKQGFKSYDHVKTISLPNTRCISTQWIEDNIPSGSKIVLEYLGPRPSRKLFEIEDLRKSGLRKKIDLEKYDYIVASSGNYGRFFRDKNRYFATLKIYKEAFKKYKLIKEFTANNTDMTGPTIKILKVH